MKEIKFRPLRRIKKTGKITVASYGQWRKIKTSDSASFNLIIDSEYKKLSDEDFVYNHRGEQLFFYDYKPWDIAVVEEIPFDFRHTNIPYAIGRGENIFYYSAAGLDCDGVPLFNYYHADYIATRYRDITPFEPLTVKTVKDWFGWFLYQLENLCLQE